MDRGARLGALRATAKVRPLLQTCQIRRINSAIKCEKHRNDRTLASYESVSNELEGTMMEIQNGNYSLLPRAYHGILASHRVEGTIMQKLFVESLINTAKLKAFK